MLFQRFTFPAWLALATAVLPTASVDAQRSPILSVDASAGMAYPLGDWGKYAESGPSYTAGASLYVVPSLAVFARYSVADFGYEDPGGGRFDAREEGVTAGVSMVLNTSLRRSFPLSPWVSLAAVFHDVETDGMENGIEEETGLEAQAGLELAPLPGVRIRPSVAWRVYRLRTTEEWWEDGFRPLPPNTVEYLRPSLGISVVL